MVNGLNLDAAALKITQITAAELVAQLASFATTDNGYNAGRSAIKDATEAVQAQTEAVATYLAAVKSAVEISFGKSWSTQWVQVGFITPSLAIPRKIEDQLSLADRMIAFLTANAGYEVPAKDVTAAAGTALVSSRTAAVKALTDLEKAQTTLDTNWTAENAALRDTMWSLIKILQGSLNDDDPRWLDFGLPLPGTSATPDAPTNLTAHLDGAKIIVSCDTTPLATRYRFRLRLLGVDADYQLASSSPAPLGTITGVLPGQTVELIVQAVNENLQSVASAPIVFTVPLVAPVIAPAVKPVSVEDAPVYRNGTNGHTNGNGHARV